MDLSLFKNITINGQRMTSLSIGGVVIWSLGSEPEPTESYVNVDLNGQWVASTYPIDGYHVYMSDSNYHVANSVAWAKVTFKGHPDFKLYINSFAESNYDYTIAFKLDTEKTEQNPSSTSSEVQAHTKGNQKDPAAGIDNYTIVEYPNDGQEHFVWVCYIKDISGDNNIDRGSIAMAMNYKYFKQVLVEDSYMLVDNVYYQKLEVYGSEDNTNWYPTGKYEKGNPLDVTTSWDGTSLIYNDGKLYQLVDVSVILPNGSVVETGDKAQGGYVKDYSMNDNNTIQYWTDYGQEEPKDPLLFDVSYIGTFTYSDHYVWAFENNVGMIGSSALSNISAYSLYANVSIIDEFGVINARNLTTISLPNVIEIGTGAFANCINLQRVYLPQCQRMSYDAFRNCSNITYMEAPMCTEVSGGAFGNCVNLSVVKLPRITSLYSGTFSSCSSLKLLYINEGSSLVILNSYASYVFSGLSLTAIFVHSSLYSEYYRSSYSYWGRESSYIAPYSPLEESIYLTYDDGTSDVIELNTTFIPMLKDITSKSITQIDAPTCTSVMYSAFYMCYNVSSINLPVCKVIGDYGLRSISSLYTINLPEVEKVNTYGLANNINLTTVSLPICSEFGFKTFNSCSNLTQLYINSVTSVPYINSTTFDGCSKLTSIYVPTSLVDSFKKASNWSSLSSKFVGV